MDSREVSFGDHRNEMKRRAGLSRSRAELATSCSTLSPGSPNALLPTITALIHRATAPPRGSLNFEQIRGH